MIIDSLFIVFEKDFEKGCIISDENGEKIDMKKEVEKIILEKAKNTEDMIYLYENLKKGFNKKWALKLLEEFVKGKS